MSNWKHAYGWFGHIVTPESEASQDKADKAAMVKAHVWPIKDIQFLAIKAMHDAGKMPANIRSEQLGITGDDAFYFVALGHPKTFCEGFQFYGTAFDYMDLKHGGWPDFPRSHDQLYRKALKRHFDLSLPVSRFMVGVSSEH